MESRRALVPLVLAAALLGLARPAAPASDPRVSKTAVDRIQRECLRAYPDDVRADMASGATEIPRSVDARPEEQMKFLDKELEVEKGLFYPSLLEEVAPPFERFVQPGTRFLDLGSGDGRVVFLASLFGAHAVGIEWDPILVRVSLDAQEALADLVDAERIEILQGDFFDIPWSDYDVIFYFDESSMEHERLRAKMKRELAPGARLIVGHEIHPFPGYDLEAELENMKVYRQPVSPGPGERRE